MSTLKLPYCSDDDENTESLFYNNYQFRSKRIKLKSGSSLTKVDSSINKKNEILSSSSFIANKNYLCDKYPSLSTSIVISLLETASNNVEKASMLIQQIFEANKTPLYDKMIGNETNFFLGRREKRSASSKKNTSELLVDNEATIHLNDLTKSNNSQLNEEDVDVYKNNHKLNHCIDSNTFDALEKKKIDGQNINYSQHQPLLYDNFNYNNNNNNNEKNAFRYDLSMSNSSSDNDLDNSLIFSDTRSPFTNDDLDHNNICSPNITNDSPSMKQSFSSFETKSDSVLLNTPEIYESANLPALKKTLKVLSRVVLVQHDKIKQLEASNKKLEAEVKNFEVNMSKLTNDISNYQSIYNFFESYMKNPENNKSTESSIVGCKPIFSFFSDIRDSDVF